MTRVQKITLVTTEYEQLAARAGGTREGLQSFLRGATSTLDLMVREVMASDVQAVIFVESASFAGNSCCWKSSAPEWLVKL